jgi:hypothetical protein
MDAGMFRGLEYVFVAFFISIPLALWKLIDIVVWLYNNVSINFGG